MNIGDTISCEIFSDKYNITRLNENRYEAIKLSDNGDNEYSLIVQVQLTSTGGLYTFVHHKHCFLRDKNYNAMRYLLKHSREAVDIGVALRDANALSVKDIA